MKNTPRPHVLLVADDQALVSKVVMALHASATVHVAAEAEEATRMLSGVRGFAAFLVHQGSAARAAAFVKHAKSAHPSAPVVLLAAKTGTHAKAHAKKLGATVVVEPFDRHLASALSLEGPAPRPRRDPRGPPNDDDV